MIGIVYVLACAVGTDTAPGACAALEDSPLVTSVSDEHGDLPLSVEVRELGAAAPVAVLVPGGWDTGLTAESANVALTGAITVHMALSAATWENGANNARGEEARAAVALALRYAADEVADSSGCRLADRVPGVGGAPLLVGQSNGGNLAMATLADTALNLPNLLGVVLWETPAGGGFVNRDSRRSPRLYEAGSCTFAADTGVECPLPESIPLVDGDGVPCFDMDADGSCGEGDITESAEVDPSTGLFAGSPVLAARIEEAGLRLGWDDPAASLAFWSTRDAARAAPAVVARLPELPFLLVASESDHMLSDLRDHPHVFGFGQALQAAGARWVRLNPGAAYTDTSGENAPNMPLSLAEPRAWFVAEEEEDPLGDYLGAAIDELVDRHVRDDW